MAKKDNDWQKDASTMNKSQEREREKEKKKTKQKKKKGKWHDVHSNISKYYVQ